jgi:hypothetical protein
MKGAIRKLIPGEGAPPRSLESRRVRITGMAPCAG